MRDGRVGELTHRGIGQRASMNRAVVSRNSSWSSDSSRSTALLPGNRSATGVEATVLVVEGDLAGERGLRDHLRAAGTGGGVVVNVLVNTTCRRLLEHFLRARVGDVDRADAGAAAASQPASSICVASGAETGSNV